MDIDALNRMVEDDAALRRRQNLQPAGGTGDKIFPPTYPASEQMKRLLGKKAAPPRHVYERRRIDGQDVWCVLVDSVQSQANRLEECLLRVIGDGVPIPHVLVDFARAGLEGVTAVTSLDAPHRIYDAILRDSLAHREPFMSSSIGKRLAKATAQDAAALLELSPNALLFGAWHSTGDGGGLGAKFARCLTSEIVAVGVPVEDVLVNQRTGETEPQTAARRTGSRIDPLGVLRGVDVFKGEKGWSTTEVGAGGKARKVRPSEVNHGNIAPSVQPLGVTCDRLEHTFVLSFAALRRLRFGSPEKPEKNAVARTLLAALGLVALIEQDAAGYALRSRCDLVCDGRAPLEAVRADGTTECHSLDREGARDLYARAFAAAKAADFDLSGEPLRLTPQDKLVEIVRRSQELALSGRGGDEADNDEENA